LKAEVDFLDFTMKSFSGFLLTVVLVFYAKSFVNADGHDNVSMQTNGSAIDKNVTEDFNLEDEGEVDFIKCCS
jgi:hypothetical protein